MQQGTVRAGQTLRFDVVVIGAGVAGLVSALDLLDAAPDTSVAIIDKGVMGSAGSTPLAQGGMAAAVGPDDSPRLHAADTVRAGDGLCDLQAVHVLAGEGPARVADLIARGARFDRRPDGSLDLAREGGQAVPRSVRAADATGAEIFRALRAAAAGRVTRIQGIVCELARTPDGVVGAWAVLDEAEASPVGPAQEAGLVLVRARRVLLASGGCGGLYGATTNRAGATADGVALAARAGAQLVDLEFVQFHPTGLRPDPDAARAAAERGASEGEPADDSWRLLLTEALRGAGAVLRDAHGHRFMRERHPDAELAPRHVVAKGILDQPGGAWLDATHIDAAVLEHEFPTVSQGVRRYGFDLSREPVPVEPVEHYMIGGVATDLQGRTSIPGLSAAGEVACTGVHGANRMAGNSLLQACVFGHRAALEIAGALEAGAAGDPADPEPPALAPAAASPELPELRRRVRRAMSAGAGAVRSSASLATARAALDDAAAAIGSQPAATRDSIELHHLVGVARLITRSAALRRESRGVHWREDHAGHDTAWEGVRLRVQLTAG